MHPLDWFTGQERDFGPDAAALPPPGSDRLGQAERPERGN